LFWCSEHVFEAVVGVDEAISGYAGGTTKNPSMNKLVLTILVMLKLLPFTMTQMLFQGISECVFASQDPTTPINKGQIVVLPIALLPL
jgi:peptide-methionine (S)-S-oxide reductase